MAETVENTELEKLHLILNHLCLSVVLGVQRGTIVYTVLYKYNTVYTDN